jgi:hypothetical protein
MITSYKFTPDKLDLAWYASRMRLDTNPWNHENEKKILIDGLVGVAGELAFSDMSGIEHESLALPAPQYGILRKSGKADLGPFEIRTASYHYSGFSLKKKDKPGFCAVLMSAPGIREIGEQLYNGSKPEWMPVVHLVGWLPMDEAIRKAVEISRNGKVWNEVRYKDLRKPDDLLIKTLEKIQSYRTNFIREYNWNNDSLDPRSFRISKPNIP